MIFLTKIAVMWPSHFCGVTTHESSHHLVESDHRWVTWTRTVESLQIIGLQ